MKSILFIAGGSAAGLLLIWASLKLNIPTYILKTLVIVSATVWLGCIVWGRKLNKNLDK